ncbi:DUF2971 domain-containing protein [Subdoligranulum variabile]|uniref:DUF2971 domain-containing protein n=1 Tax=Subdoligranulum variabile TaxID=214851 RepID=UPI002943AD50|nr:DUF2971 domain-containing protein [Subdoligranulum variabile]
MDELQESITDESWKQSLRSAIITVLTESGQTKNKALEQVGYYYQYCAPAFLYKYYRDQALNLDSVMSNKMWYSAPCNFNDAFDCDVAIDEQAIFKSLLPAVPGGKIIRKGSPVWLQLKSSLHKQITLLHRIFEDQKVSMGIACLSEVPDSILMWSHYANNHRGFCVAYNLLDLNHKLQFSAVPVLYTQERVCLQSISLDQSKLNKETMSLFIQSLTSKSMDWSYEKEWRIIRDKSSCGLNWDNKNKGALLDVISPSAIFLGCYASDELTSTLKQYCQNHKIPLHKMKKDPLLYRLKKETIWEFDE